MKHVTFSCHRHGGTTIYNASVDKIVRPCMGFHSRACRGQWQSHWMAAAAPPLNSQPSNGGVAQSLVSESDI
jgi:hypothetical protein